ncbi:MAG: Lrp/AsnC family transcriptional regulator [Proteobacteria bacterium]|nr:Lrp/AsnC family transcriptional regulator [Pseudomonadota bacterium]
METPDRIDLTILRELEIDAGQTTKSLAAKLGMNRITVGKRMNNLVTRRIAKPTAIVDPRILGYRVRANMVLNTSPKSIDAVAEELASFEFVQHVIITAGRYDIIVWALFRDNDDLSRFATGQVAQIRGLKNLETLINLAIPKASFAFLSDDNVSMEVKRPSRDLDEFELRLIKVIRNDPCATYSELASKLDTSPTTVRRRVQKLQDERAIKYAYLLNPFALGKHTWATIALNVDPGMVHSVAEKLVSYNNLRNVVVIAGRYDLLVWGVFSDADDLSDFVRNELSNIQGLRNIETMINLRLVKNTVTFAPY